MPEQFDHWVGCGGATCAARLDTFADALGAAGLDAALVSHHRNVLYLAGTAQPCNLLVVPGRRPVLFARRFGERVRAESPVAIVRDGGGFADVRDELVAAGVTRGVLGLEFDVMPVALFRRAAGALVGFALEDCAALVLRQRSVKDAEEVAALRRAAELFVDAHQAVVEHLRAGVREHELAAEVMRAVRRAGHVGLVMQRRWDAVATPESIASGENLWQISGGSVTVSGVGLSRALPLGPSAREVRPGDLVNLDVGLCLDGYHADVARTYVLGEPSGEIVALAGAVRGIEDACLRAIRPGIEAAEVFAVAEAAAGAAGVGEFFQGFGATRGRYIGHGLGLELDEPPTLAPGDLTHLQPGMVLAVEPKLISPAFGALNLEDDVVVTDEGCDVLGDVPRTVFALDGAGGAEPITP